MPFSALAVIAMVLSLVAQNPVNQTLTNPMPSDARSNQFEEPVGTSWRVFAVDSYDKGPLAIVEVQEVRQQNPPSSWAVLVQNRSLLPVTYTLAAAVVNVDGNVKAIQPLPTIKNLQPTKVSRQQMRVIITVIAPTDRVVFFVNEILGETTPWKAAKTDIATMIKTAAKLLPVP